jgi:hypothetical protein
MTRISRVYALIGIILGLTLPTGMAVADNEDAMLPLPTLTAQWWQWALSIPTDQNPNLDTNGQDCMIGQRGSVWFLAGIFGSSTVTRKCSVPEDTTLFFPLINAINFNTPNVCGQGPENLTVKNMRALSKASIDGAHSLSVRVDGKSVINLLQRIQSQVFEVALPEITCSTPCVWVLVWEIFQQEYIRQR